MSRLTAAAFLTGVFICSLWTALAPLPPLWPLPL